MLKYLARCVLLTLGFALTTYGLVAWQHAGFSFSGIWPNFADLRVHPVHLLVLGLAMIPPAIWELFLLDARRGDRE